MRHLVLKNLSGKKVLLFFVLANIVYLTMLFITIPKVMRFSDGIKVLDMMPGGYDINYVQTLFSELGEEGRAVYLYQQIPLDMIYPTLFAVSFCLLFAYFLKRINKENTYLLSIAYLPIIGGSFDYIENLGIISLLNSFPEISKTHVFITNLATLIKIGTTTIYFVALVILLIAVGMQALKK